MALRLQWPERWAQAQEEVLTGFGGKIFTIVYYLIKTQSICFFFAIIRIRPLPRLADSRCKQRAYASMASLVP
jgi:hypothetical protein